MHQAAMLSADVSPQGPELDPSPIRVRFARHKGFCQQYGCPLWLSSRQMLRASLHRGTSTVLVNRTSGWSLRTLKEAVQSEEFFFFFHGDFFSCLMVLACLFMWTASDNFLSCILQVYGNRLMLYRIT